MHSLRKGFGCRYAGKVSAHVLQRLMRHANIKTTLDYYANIDVAVEEAVLGPQRNDLRNSTPMAGNSRVVDMSVQDPPLDQVIARVFQEAAPRAESA